MGSSPPPRSGCPHSNSGRAPASTARRCLRRRSSSRCRVRSRTPATSVGTQRGGSGRGTEGSYWVCRGGGAPLPGAHAERASEGVRVWTEPTGGGSPGGPAWGHCLGAGRGLGGSEPGALRRGFPWEGTSGHPPGSRGSRPGGPDRSGGGPSLCALWIETAFLMGFVFDENSEILEKRGDHFVSHN